MSLTKKINNINFNIPSGSVIFIVHGAANFYYTTSIEETVVNNNHREKVPNILICPARSKIYVIKRLGKCNRDKFLTKYLCTFNNKPYYLLFNEQNLDENLSIFPPPTKEEKKASNKCQINNWLTKQYNVYGNPFLNVGNLNCISGMYNQNLYEKSVVVRKIPIGNEYYKKNIVIGKSIEICPGKHCLIFNFYLKGNICHWEFHDRSGKKDFKQFNDHWRRAL